LTGDLLNLSSNFAVSVNDATGSKAGWNLQASIGALTADGGDRIPATNHTIQGVALSETTSIPPVNGINQPLVIPTASGKIFNAAAHTGTGTAMMTFNTRLVVPADTTAGAYTATLTVTIAAEP